MRILLVTAMFPPIQTGTSFYSRNVADSMHRLGHDVTVLTAEFNGGASDDGAVPVHRLPALHVPLKNFFKHLRFVVFSPANWVRTVRIARKARPEAVFLVNHYLDIAFLAIIASRVTRAPLVCSVGTQVQSTRRFRHWVLRTMDRVICGGLIFPACARLVAWDREILRYIRTTHGRRAAARSVIVPYGPNGAAEVYFGHQHEYGRHRQILGVGAVIEQRNFLSLVRAFAEILKKHPDVTLKIVGHVYHDAPVRLAAELGVADRVVFTGEQPHAFVLEEMKRSACFWALATGRYVGLGTAAIEAMFLGVPIVSDVPEDLLGDNILRGGDNYMQCVADTTAPDALEQLVSDATLQRHIGEGGRRLAMEHLQWDRVAGRLCEVLAAGAGHSGL